MSCRLMFKHCFDMSQMSWKFSEYPAPFNQLFKTSMENHAAQDMSLDMAHKSFLPDKTLYNEERKLLVLLFNTGGKSKTDNPKFFLKDFLPLFENRIVKRYTFINLILLLIVQSLVNGFVMIRAALSSIDKLKYPLAS
jgi:hypothetical protein